MINCEFGSEEKVYSQLKSMSKIKETREVFGAYDIISKIEASSVDMIKEIIATKIRGIDRIRSVLTLMGNEKKAELASI